MRESAAVAGQARDDERTIRLEVPALVDHVSLVRGTVRVVAGRVGAPDDTRSRLQAAAGHAFFALLDAVDHDRTATVAVEVWWGDGRIDASLAVAPPPAAAPRLHDGLADGHEVDAATGAVHLWAAVSDEG